MMQQAYATALWYLSCVMPVSHTDQNSPEAVPSNESSTTTASCGKIKHARSIETTKDCSATVSNNRADSSVTVELSTSGSVIAQRSASASVSANIESFGNKSKHACSSETAKEKDCSTTVSGKNHASSSITANKISSETVSGNESSGTTASFGNDSKHASISETAKDCSTTVPGKNHASSATKISAHSVNKANKARQANATWRTTVYFVMVTTLLTSFALEVQGDLLSITNEDCTYTGATTEQWRDFRTAEKCAAFPVQLDKTQHQRSVQLHRWRTLHRDELISTQQQASKQKTAEHNASAKLANNAEAEVSRKSAEKERRTVEQTEHQAAQEAQEAILHDIQTALDSISKRVTAIEETQQRDW